MVRKHTLLQDIDVKRWYRHLARSSEATADTYLEILGKFCDATGLTPKDLLALADEEIRNIVLDYVTSLEETKDYSSSYLRSIVNAVKSWLRFNNRDISIQYKNQIQPA